MMNFTQNTENVLISWATGSFWYRSHRELSWYTAASETAPSL